MDFLTSLNISGSGLTVQRKIMNTISENLANSETTRTSSGSPYRRKIPVIEQAPATDLSSSFSEESEAEQGVRVSDIVEDNTPLKVVHNPGHPDADEEGSVLMPNVDTVVEMTNMLMAKRAYESNIAAINTLKGMAIKALEIGK
ncbi:MAG: flagellar basal body rod protein FlgC [Pseudomonadota bacterium]